MQLEEPSRRW